MDADEALGILELGGERGDRQGRGIGGEDGVVANDRLHLGDDVGLDLAVLKHGLDDEIAVLQRAVVAARRDLLQERVALGALHTALVDAVGQRFVHARLAFVGGLLVAVDQHHVESRRGRDLRDTGAHEAGADDAYLLELRGRLLRRAARALVQFLHRHEQGADHRRRLRRAQDLGEPARLDAQRGVHVELQAFVDDLHDGACRGIIVVCLAAIDGIRRREGHHAGLRPDEAAGQTEALLVPWRHRLAAAFDPLLRCLDQIGRGHDRVDELHRLGAIGLQLLAFEQELQRVGGRQDARHALRTAGAGEQTDLDLGQAEPCLRIV